MSIINNNTSTIKQSSILYLSMHTKLINTRMQQFKHSPNPKPSQQPQEKQNIPHIPTKNQSKKYLHQAQQLIMQQHLKQIVHDNLQYFRNIINPKDSTRPNSLTLKLPAKMNNTLYQSDYLKRKQYQSQPGSIDLRRQHAGQCVKRNGSECKLPAKTTYQNEFRKVDETGYKKRQTLKQVMGKRSISNNAPTFLDTHNSLQYRDWGTGSVMPSMKPSPKAATTDIPFKASSMYRTDFHSVELSKTQLVTHEETFPQSIDLWMGRSSYGKDFQRKKAPNRQQPYKPKQSPGATYLPFKSTTEYKDSYMQSGHGKDPKLQKKQQKNISDSDIERIVMDL